MGLKLDRNRGIRARIRGITLGVLVLFGVLPVHAAFLYPVQNGQSLADIALRLKNPVDSGTHIVQFRNYSQVGAFQLLSPSGRLDSLVFERDPSLQSDSAIPVAEDVALIEVKAMKRGTVVLRGLAFRFLGPESRLLAGNEDGKANFNLVIDSCFFFGDAMTTSFLSWLGAANSRIEIKRSFFVFRTGGPTLAKASFTAKDILFANNLFNFTGQIAATAVAQGRVEAFSNTFNRTQLRLNADSPNQSTFLMVQNFIGYKGPADAFTGTENVYFLWATAFNALASVVSSTHMYPGWSGFGIPGVSLEKFDADTTNRVVSNIGGKDPAELWDWYKAGPDTLHGHQDGIHRRKERYDVWPGSNFKPIFYETNNTGRVYFRPAPFPRQLTYSRIPSKAAGEQAEDIRIHAPTQGAMHFGSFQVDSITMNMGAPFGRPTLLAGDTEFRFAPQRVGNQDANRGFWFPNDSLAGRYFYFGFRGNTRRGLARIPGEGSLLRLDDTLVYARVDSAGQTSAREETQPASSYPDSLRYLNRNMFITTSAAVRDSMVFGTRDFLPKPWLPSKVFWWNVAGKTLIPADPLPDGRFIGKTPAVNNLSVYLVEKTNVKRGTPTVFPLPNKAELRVQSVSGFQIEIDSLTKADTVRFGAASPAYRFTSLGRGTEDVMSLKLPGGNDVESFKTRGDTVTLLTAQKDTAGFLTVNIPRADSLARFFSAIRYNVIAGQVFNQNLQGVSVTGLRSRTSGLFSIQVFNDALLDQGIGTPDIFPEDYRGLGGKGISTRFLQLDSSTYSVNYQIRKAGDHTQVEAYAWDGLRWRALAKPTVDSSQGLVLLAVVTGLRQGDQAVVVVERLQPAVNYVAKTVALKGRVLEVATSFTNTEVRPIISFRVVVQYTTPFGTFDSTSQVTFPIGQTALVDLSGLSGLFRYRVIYQTLEGDYNRNPEFIYIGEFGFQPKNLQVPKPSLGPRQWHLLGYPYNTDFTSTLSKGPLLDTSVRDTTVALRLVSAAGRAKWDTLKTVAKQVFPAGEAFLMSSSRNFAMAIDSNATFESNAPKVLNQAGTPGWRLVSPPFPMSFHPTKVVSSVGPADGFLELRIQDAPPGTGQVKDYEWVPAQILKPFEGYAYLYRVGETMIFDPWNANRPAGALKASAESETGVKLFLASGSSTRRMEFRDRRAARSIPFLAPPGGGPQLRVGGEGGFLRKAVENLAGLDEIVEIRAEKAQDGRLSLERLGGMVGRPDWQARLLDPVSGRSYDLTAGGELALPAGSSSYRLVAGDGDFVRGRLQEFLAGLPPGLSLSQNFPNPFSKSTSITLDWPALSSGASADGAPRVAWLEVFDSRGRRIHRLDFGRVAAGRQTAVLDATRWDAGLYTYRLTVASGAGRLHLQKKMLVTK